MRINGITTFPPNSKISDVDVQKLLSKCAFEEIRSLSSFPQKKKKNQQFANQNPFVLGLFPIYTCLDQLQIIRCQTHVQHLKQEALLLIGISGYCVVDHNHIQWTSPLLH